MPDRSTSRRRSPWPVVLVAVLAGLFPIPVAAQDGGAPSEVPSGEGGGHFAAPDPADLTAEQASEIYRDIRDQMVRGYRQSGNNAARNFLRWERFNSAPYRSATHGERFVNNYANASAGDYGLFEAAGEMPDGAVIVKDTFYVAQSGGVFPGRPDGHGEDVGGLRRIDRRLAILDDHARWQPVRHHRR